MKVQGIIETVYGEKPIEEFRSLNSLNPQLVYPKNNIREYVVKSPWDNNLYSIRHKQITTGWVDSRYATTIIAVLDTSSSMGLSCLINGELYEEQDLEEYRITKFNLVQQSMNTVVEMLNQGDELVLIKFNSTSECIFNEKITELNKSSANSIINSLNVEGESYIWNGLEKAYEYALRSSNNNVHIMLLTDGKTLDLPYDELKKYFESKQNEIELLQKIKLTTFGFSYDINSRILFDMAEFTNSHFNFIPDSSMVGTTICNYLANILSPDLFVADIKSIKNDQDYDYITSFELINDYLKYELIRYHCYQILKDVCLKSEITTCIINPIDLRSIITINQFKEWIQNLIKKKVGLENYLDLLKNMLKDFISDDESHEQITKALTKSYWFKYEYHYLLSLSLAHKTRQCHNFKYEGVQLYGFLNYIDYNQQFYGSTKFIELRYEACLIFNRINETKPLFKADIIDNSLSLHFNNLGGCFGPNCKIKLVDGSFVRLDKLVGNELVYQGEDNKGSKIKYIIKTEIPEGFKYMCQIDNLVISEYHPIYNLNLGKWIYPINLIQSQKIIMNSMYNIILESGHWVEIEGYKCVSLAHQLEKFDSTNQILKHKYFGSIQVIKDFEFFSLISNSNQINPKIINICNHVVLRDRYTNFVCGIKPIYNKISLTKNLNNMMSNKLFA